MYTRLLSRPNHSAFLFGPRGTGKSTWIHKHFQNALRYDLLSTAEYLRLSKNPGLLYQEVASLPENSWVVLDEVQKVPSLLDEVHRLIEEKKVRFLLCGSSARKLKRGGANLLAGRAVKLEMFPLVTAEVSQVLSLEKICRYGMLPMALDAENPQAYLQSYVETYLEQEIKAEALTRNIGGFSRFLEIAARQNGQITVVSNIARDAMVNRLTVQDYFEILCDTLMGFWLEAWRLKRATKQILSPKFYFFDAGVARALSNRSAYPPTEEEFGFLLETFLLGEIRAFISYRGLGYPIYFWSSADRVEVDLFCETTKGFVALEIKASPHWDRKFNRPLHRIQEELGKGKVSVYGIYSGERELLVDGVQVLPWNKFLQNLWQGKVIEPPL